MSLKMRLRALGFRIGMSPTLKHYTVPEAAAFLGLHPSRVRQHIVAGKLLAERAGRMYLIREDDLKVFAATPREPGRPRKGRLNSKWRERRREAAARANEIRKATA